MLDGVYNRYNGVLAAQNFGGSICRIGLLVSLMQQRNKRASVIPRGRWLVDGAGRARRMPTALSLRGNADAGYTVCALSAHEDAYGTRVQSSGLMEGLPPLPRLRLWV